MTYRPLIFAKAWAKVKVEFDRFYDGVSDSGQGRPEQFSVNIGAVIVNIGGLLLLLTLVVRRVVTFKW